MEEEDMFDLLANPHKKNSKKSDIKKGTTIDDEIIRLINMKLSELNIKNIDNKKFEKVLEYIKLL